MPSEFIKKIAETSNYLSYWYSNIPSNVQSNINGLAHLQTQEIGRLQLANFKQIQKAAVKKVNNAAADKSMKELGTVFDTAIYQDGLGGILEPLGTEVENLTVTAVSYSLENIEQAITELKEIVNKDNAGKRLGAFSKAVTQILQSVFIPTKGTIQEIAQKMFIDYAKANVAGISGNKKLNGVQISRTITHIINNVLAKENRQVFNVNTMDQEYGNMNSTVKKFLLVVAALDNFNGGTAETNIDSEVLKKLSEKVVGATDWMKIEAAEIALRKAAIEGNIDFLEGIIRVESTIKSYKSSSGWLEVKVDLEKDATFKNLLNELKQASNIAANHTSENGSGFMVNKNSVIGTLDFNVKSGKEVGGASLPGRVSGLQIQNSTLISTLLKDAGLSSAAHFGVLQLLAAHEKSGGELDGIWNDLKEKLIYLAAIHALVDSPIGDQALFMILDGQVLSVGEMLTNLFSKESAVQSITNSSSKNGYGLNRGDYTSLNSWLGDGPNPIAAIYRSTTAQNLVSNLLYSTKINIMLNLQSIFSLI